MAFDLLKKIQKIKTPTFLKPLAGNLLFKKEPEYDKAMKFPVKINLFEAEGDPLKWDAELAKKEKVKDLISEGRKFRDATAMSRLKAGRPLFTGLETAEKEEPFLPQLSPKKYVGEPGNMKDFITNVVLEMPEATFKTLPFIKLLREPAPTTVVGRAKAIGNEAVDFVRGLGQLALTPGLSVVSLLKDEPIELQVKNIPFLGEVPTYERQAYEQLIMGVSPLEVGISLGAQAAITAGILGGVAAPLITKIKPRVITKTSKTSLSRQDIIDITAGKPVSEITLKAFKKSVEEGIKLGQALKKGNKPIIVKMKTPNAIGEILYRPVGKGMFERIVPSAKSVPGRKGLPGLVPMEPKPAFGLKGLEIQKVKEVGKGIKPKVGKKEIIRTEAESLKEIEAGKGLVVIKGKRVTEHSPAYSAFYKEHGRRPVSVPDWEMIAEAELEAGRSAIGQVEAYRATTEGAKAVAEEINVKEIFETMDSQAKMDRLVRANMISKQEKAEFIKTLKADLARAFERTRQLTPFEGKRVARAFEEYIKTSGIKDKIFAMSEEQLLKIRIRGEVRGAKEGERVGRVETRIKVKAQIKERQTKQALRSKIIKELKDTKVRKQAGKPVGKFTPEVQITLNKLREASKFTKSERELKIQNNLEKYKDSIPPEEVALENKILSMIAGMEEMSISELGNILAQVRTIKETGKLTAELKKFNRQADINQWVDKTIDIVTGGKGLPANISTIGIRELRPEILKEKVQKFIGTTGRIFFGWDNMLDMLARKTKIEPGKTWLDTFADVTTQKNAVKRGERINTDKIREFAQKNLNVKNDRQLVKRFQDDAMEISLGTFKNKQGIMTEIIYTKSEARKAWMELQDPTLKQSFEEGMNYTDAIIKAIENFLTEQDKAFARKQLDFYKDYYKGVNDIYRDIYGVDLPKNEFYSPIKREGIARDESTGFGEFLQEISIRKSVTSGSLKSRVKNIKPLHKQSDAAVLEQHISEMEHFKGWAHKIRDLRAVFGNPQVRTAIIREHGKGLLATIDNFLNDFTRGGIEIASRLDSLDRLRGNYSRAVLAVKPAIGIKQLTSFIAYADVVPAVEFGKWTIDFWKNPLEKIRILGQSEMMKVRGKYMERDIKTALRSDAYASFRKHPSFLNTLMLNIQAGDQGAIYAGGWAVYKYQRGLGKSHKEALHIFERETSNVQQSADLDNLSQWQRSGSFAKLFTMFGSAPNMFFRKEMGAIRNATHGRGTYRQHVKTIIIFHFLIPMFFQWVSDFFQWDPEEQKRAAILGSFNGIFIVKDGLEYLIRGALGMRQYSSEIPILGIAKEFGKATKLVNDDDITTEDVFKAIRGLAGASGSLTGLPLKQPIDIATGIKDVLTGEYAQGLAEILGWSPYIAEKKAGKKKKKQTLPALPALPKTTPLPPLPPLPRLPAL